MKSLVRQSQILGKESTLFTDSVGGLDGGLAVKSWHVQLVVIEWLCDDRGQLVETLVPQSPSSMILYQSQGSETLQLGG